MTHTGQQWDQADPRSVRFAVSGLQKETNKEWAIDLIAEVPPQKVSKRIVRIRYYYLTAYSCVSVLRVVASV